MLIDKTVSLSPRAARLLDASKLPRTTEPVMCPTCYRSHARKLTAVHLCPECAARCC